MRLQVGFQIADSAVTPRALLVVAAIARHRLTTATRIRFGLRVVILYS